MYTPERFMTVELVDQVLREFTWPVRYTLEDCDPDGVAMDFDGGTVMFNEGFEGHVRIKLLADDVELPRSVTLTEVIGAMRDSGEVPPTPMLIDDSSPSTSSDKVKNGIRDQVTLLLTFLPGYLVGDRNWVEVVRPFVR
jgi:hypothetical protein